MSIRLSSKAWLGIEMRLILHAICNVTGTVETKESEFELGELAQVERFQCLHRRFHVVEAVVVVGGGR